MNNVIRVGTRGSSLALKQTGIVIEALRKRFPSISFNTVIINTLGDRDKSAKILEESVGIFTKDIESRLLQNDIDIAVHSLKDLSTELPSGLKISAYLKRDDPRDLLISRKKSLKFNSTLGTTSIRRQRQLRILREDLRVIPLRGNITTRINRLQNGDYDAIIIAKAGLDRIDISTKGLTRKVFTYNEMLPAIGQGVLAVQIRSKDRSIDKIVSSLNHSDTEMASRSERALLRALKAGCRAPVGAIAKTIKNRLVIQAAVFSHRSTRVIKAHLTGPKSRPESLGVRAAKILLNKGASRIINMARKS